MNLIKYTLLALLVTASMGQLEAQRITRSTICSTGGTFTTATTQLRSTFGQCPGCNKIGNNNNSIYQGFQQPVSTTNIEEPEVPCFQSSFVAEVFTTECGASYSFEYLGTADPEITEFTWDFGMDAFPTSSNLPNPQDVAYSSVGDKIISLTVSQDSCTETVRMMINVTQTGYGVNADISDVLCVGDENGAITLTASGGSGAYSYSWEDGSTDITRENLAAGEYAYTVSDGVSCAYAGVAVVQPADSILINGLVTNESATDAGDGSIILEITGGVAPYTFLWSDGTVSQNRDELVSGFYSVTVTDSNDCTTSVEFDFNTQEGGAGVELVPEDVFTPNGDNINDTWVIDGIENFPNNQLLIYNRWGQLVYSTRGYANSWTGTNSDGEELQTGAYWYIFQLNDPNDIRFSGVVTLVR